MRLIGFALLLFFFGSVNSSAQTPLLRDPDLLELESILGEYKDITTTRLQVDSDYGVRVLLELSYAELMQTKIHAFASEGDVFLGGYFTSDFLSPSSFLHSLNAKSQSVWEFELDSDGDLSYYASFTPESRENMEELVTTYVVLLQSMVEPYLSIDEAVNLIENPLFDVELCAQSIEREWVGLPEELLSQANALDYCDCLKGKLEFNPDLLTAMLNPGSEEGRALIESCWTRLVPNWEALGLTADIMFRDLDQEQMQATAKKSFVRTCVQAMMEDSESPSNNLTYAGSEAYCECRFDAVKEREGISLEDMADPNSDAMIEVGASCVHLLGMNTPAGWNVGKSADDCVVEQRVPLLWDGSAYQMRLNLGGVTKYITLDTGASEVIISTEWLDAIRSENGELKYLGSEFFELADGRPISVKRYSVGYLAIGECTISNFTVGVMDEGGMLCGMGLLGLFGTWAVDTNRAELILNP